MSFAFKLLWMICYGFTNAMISFFCSSYLLFLEWPRTRTSFLNTVDTTRGKQIVVKNQIDSLCWHSFDGRYYENFDHKDLSDDLSLNNMKLYLLDFQNESYLFIFIGCPKNTDLLKMNISIIWSLIYFNYWWTKTSVCYLSFRDLIDDK